MKTPVIDLLHMGNVPVVITLDLGGSSPDQIQKSHSFLDECYSAKTAIRCSVMASLGESE